MKKKYIIGIVILITVLIIGTIIYKNNCKKDNRSITYENSKVRDQLIEKFEKDKILPNESEYKQNENAGGLYVKIKNNDLLLEKTNLDTSIKIQEFLTDFFETLNDTDKNKYKDELKTYGITKKDYNTIFKEFDKNNKIYNVYIKEVDNNSKNISIELVINDKVNLNLEIKNNIYYNWSRK